MVEVNAAWAWDKPGHAAHMGETLLQQGQTFGLFLTSRQLLALAIFSFWAGNMLNTATACELASNCIAGNKAPASWWTD